MNESTTPRQAESDKCTICNQTRKWHEDHKPKHKFVEPGGDPQIQRVDDRSSNSKTIQPGLTPEEEALRKRLREPGRVMPLGDGPTFGFTSDPVLRMLLVEKGVITPEELSATEAKLQAISGGGIVWTSPPQTTNVQSRPPG